MMKRELLDEKTRAARGPISPAALRRRLLPWYRRNRRDLPWRRSRDPYRIWVSEVMLQQTQVATALPFYQTFLERFPTVAALARAREADVLAAWSGLGYYRRARNLLAAARLVVRDHGGQVPGHPDHFHELPGVGRYTAGAVLSIAFDRPLPVLDGNVARVLARVFALRAAVRDPRGARTLWSLAARLVPMRRAGEWNQALMELGATVCLPRGPKCDACPLRASCLAHRLDAVADFPPATARRRTERIRRAVALITWRKRLLVVRREGALLAGLWEPPGVEIGGGARPRARLEAEVERLGLSVQLEASTIKVRHRITHRDIEVQVWRGELETPPPRTKAMRWVDPTPPRAALTGLARKLTRLLV